jgi:hypothetical protein
MDKTRLIDQILLLANEDYSGLWEVYGEASAIYKNLQQPEVLKIAREAILDVVDLGWIQLYWCREPLSNDRVTSMNKGDIVNVLTEDKFWVQPEKDTLSVRFFSTSEGEKAFAKKFLK